MLDTKPIEERLAAATPGPWKCYPCQYGEGGEYGWGSGGPIHNEDDEGGELDEAKAEVDQLFINAAPTDIRALLDEVTALREALVEIKDAWGEGNAEQFWRALRGVIDA